LSPFQLFSILLASSSTMPAAVALAGAAYLARALLLGITFLYYAFRFARLRDKASVRRLSLYLICCLPLILILLMADRMRVI